MPEFKKYILSFTLMMCACSSVGPGELAGVNGLDGKQGEIGPQGDAGPPGVNGEAGAKGEPGLNGGADGKNGTDNKISRVWKCDFKRADVSIQHADGGFIKLSIQFWYYANETTSGDTFTRAGVDVASYDTPNLREGASSVQFWKAGTWEANNGANWLLQDVGLNHFNTGNWEFLLSKQANRITITYTDADYIGGPFSFDSYCQ